MSPPVWAAILGSSADPGEAYEFLERHLGHPVDRRAVRRRRLEREGELLAHEKPLPGVVELLCGARSAGICLAVASSSESSWVTGHLARLSLDRFFAHVVCAEDVPRTKPAPDLYLEAMSRLGVEPTGAVAFEDSLHGVEAAKQAGLFCVAVPNPFTDKDALHRADLVVDSLAGFSLECLARGLAFRRQSGTSLNDAS